MLQWKISLLVLSPSHPVTCRQLRYLVSYLIHSSPHPIFRIMETFKSTEKVEENSEPIRLDSHIVYVLQHLLSLCVSLCVWTSAHTHIYTYTFFSEPFEQKFQVSWPWPVNTSAGISQEQGSSTQPWYHNHGHRNIHFIHCTHCLFKLYFVLIVFTSNIDY